MARRVAVLVATDTYADAGFTALGAPVADAEAFAVLLRDPRYGAFDEVVVLHNEPSGNVAEQLEQVFATASAIDTVLVYVTGHGARDRFGNLYFAMANTRTDRLRSTGLPATFLHTLMNDGPRQQLVVLDCCYSGAFVHGMSPKGDDAGLADALPTGRGQVVLTASTKVQYAFEQDSAAGPTSVYTRVLVDGIRSGAADVDSDGLVTTEDAHTHVARQLREAGQGQQPQRWTFGLGDDIVLARAGNDRPMELLPPLPPVARRRRLPLVLTAMLASLMVAGVAAAYMLWPAAPPRLAAGTYLVSLRGTAANGATFDRQGELRIRETADVGLPYLLCLKVGFAAGDPGPGAVWFGSQPSCFGSDAPGPLVDMRIEGRDIVIEPRAHGLEPAEAMWQFSITSGLFSCHYAPDSGQVRLTPSGTAIAGALNLRGLDSCGSSGQGTFTAELSATRVSPDPYALISMPGLPVEAAPPTGSTLTGARYAVQRIQSVELTEGNLAWLDSTRRRIGAAILVLDHAAEEFEWALPDARPDLFPLRGRFTIDPTGVLVLTAERSSEQGSITTRVTWSGTLDPRGAVPVLEFMSSTTDSTMTNPQSYRAQVQLRAA